LLVYNRNEDSFNILLCSIITHYQRYLT
jgi:hypothetical protein